MKWYKTSSRPPSYVIERVSDLEHAAELMGTSPLDARQVLSAVIFSLKEHNDSEYVAPLEEAVVLLGDSPSKSAELVKAVAASMTMDKRKKLSKERAKEKVWKRRVN